MSIALFALAIVAPLARADCLVAVEPDWCSMMWTVDDDFWIGHCQLEVGPVVITVDGMSLGASPVPTPPATIFQMRPNLVIEHPVRTFQASLIQVALDEGAWTRGIGPGASNGKVS